MSNKKIGRTPSVDPGTNCMVRLPESIRLQVEARRKELEEATGLTVSMSGALRSIITQALSA